MQKNYGLIAYIRNASLALAYSLFGFATAAVATPITQTVIVDDKEWAQVSLFTNLSWNSMNAVCPAGICGSSTLNGFDMAGWTWASMPDVEILFRALTPYNGVSPNHYTEVDSAWAPAIFDVIGFSETAAFGRSRELNGFTASSNQFGNFTVTQVAAVWDLSSGNDHVITDVLFPLEFRADSYGGWFYRSVSVPEPATLTLFSLSIAVMGWKRRKPT